MAPIQLGSRSGYLVSEPELVGEVLVSKAKHYTRRTRVYSALREILGDGLLTTEGEDWRAHRRIVQPALHRRRLASFTDEIVGISTEMLDGWRGEIDVRDTMMRLTLRIVSEVLLGTRPPASTSPTARSSRRRSAATR
jgi:cytochrome P450